MISFRIIMISIIAAISFTALTAYAQSDPYSNRFDDQPCNCTNDPAIFVSPVQIDSSLMAINSSYDNKARSGGILDLMPALSGKGLMENIITGVPQFLAKRAEAESLNRALLNFREKLCSDELSCCLLPSTCLLTSAIFESEYPVSSNLLKTVFSNDFDLIPENIVYGCIGGENSKLPDDSLLAEATVQIIRLMERGFDPVHVLSGLWSIIDVTDLNRNPHSCASVLYSIGLAMNIIYTDQDQAPYAFHGFASEALDVYLDNSYYLSAINDWSPNALEQENLKNNLLLMHFQLKDLQFAWSNYQENLDNPEPDPLLFDYCVDIVIKFMQSGNRLAANQGWSKESLSVLRTRLAALSELALILKATRQENYQMAYVHTAIFAREFENSARIPNWFWQYGPIVADIAMTKNDELIKDLLQNTFTTFGSYKLKREQGYRGLTLNSYFGIQIGNERLTSDILPESSSNQLAMFSPVGIETSWNVFGTSSLGIFFSILDFGAVFNYRLHDDQKSFGESDEIIVSNEPNFGLKQILSPGVFVVFGVNSSTPISIGAGFTYTQDLRNATINENGDEKESSTLRIGLFLAADLPLLNF
jgi:hypothetical protein